MSSRAARAAALCALIAAAVPAAASCAGVLGVDAYRDAVVELCNCDALSGIDGCVEGATERLNNDPEAAAQWIKEFNGDCLCDGARRCYDRAPVCVPEGRACTDDAECCGSTEGGGPRCCDNSGSRECCVCLTCAEALQAGEIDPQSTLCEGTITLINNLLDCLCGQCVECQNINNQCQGIAVLKGECTSCISEQLNMNACPVELLACAQDAP